MKKYEFLLFDLDGTITDSGPGIRNSVTYALSKFGIEETELSQLNRFIGPPLTNSFKVFYGFDDTVSEEAVRFFREYYSKTGVFECQVYEGMKELLCQLKAEGKKLILATSKAEVFARQVLEHFQLERCFQYILGSELDGTRSKKEEVIEHIFKTCEIKDKSKVLMIGDRKHDIIGAKKNGVDSVGILFGYGDREELASAGATYIEETVADLKILLEKLS